MQPSHFRPAGLGPIFFRWVLARLQNPELQAVADLRRHAAALQRAHPFRCLIQLATAGRSATNVDWSITWLPARRRDRVRVAVLPRATTRAHPLGHDGAALALVFCFGKTLGETV